MKSRKKSDKKSVLLLGAYGRGNVGDDVFTICASNLFQDYTIYMNSANDLLLPGETDNKIHTLSTVDKGDILKKISVFIHTKQVIYWGGDLWVELYGTKYPRQLLYKMVLMNTLLRLAGKNVAYVGSGIGQLRGFSLQLARLSASMAKKIVVRDERSARLLNRKNIVVLPDIAINVPYNNPTLHKKSKSRVFSVVISVLWSIPNPKQSFPRVIKAIADVINKLPSDKFEITLLPMHVSGNEGRDDLWASEQLAELINRKSDIHLKRDLKSAVELLKNSNLIIGSRLHACILGVVNSTPTIGISYRPKVRSFFIENNLEKYCIDLDEVNRLEELFHSMYGNYDQIAKSFHTAGKYNLSIRPKYRELIDNL